MSAALGFLLAFLLLGSVWDVCTRTIPNWVTFAGVSLGIMGWLVGWWTWSFEWMLLIPVLLLVADVGKGDVKASAVIGGLMGAWAAPVLLLAFGLMIPCWWAYRLGGPYPGTWPFFPLLSGAACGIVLVRGI
jgi:Flp pilus assembly protein protease CpaA